MTSMMNVDLNVWLLTIGVLVAVIVFDLIYQIRNPHEPTFKESAIQSSIYMGLALPSPLWWGISGAASLLANISLVSSPKRACR